MPLRIFRIQHRHAFVAGQRFDSAVFFVVQRRRNRKLFDRFRRPVLFLQQSSVAHQSIRRLGKRTEKPQENRRRFRAVAAFYQAVELNSIILRCHGRLIQPRVNVRQRLQRFAIRRRFFQDDLILRHRFAEFVFLQAFSRPVEMFVDVLGHGVPMSYSRGYRPASITTRHSGRSGLLGNSGPEPAVRPCSTGPDFLSRLEYLNYSSRSTGNLGPSKIKSPWFSRLHPESVRKGRCGFWTALTPRPAAVRPSRLVRQRFHRRPDRPQRQPAPHQSQESQEYERYRQRQKRENRKARRRGLLHLKHTQPQTQKNWYDPTFAGAFGSDTPKLITSSTTIAAKNGSFNP